MSSYRPLPGISYIKLSDELKSPKKGLINIKNNDQNFFYGVMLGKKSFSKIEKKNNICLNVFCYENILTFSIYVSDQKLENSMDLLLVIDKSKSHCEYIKDFNFAKVVYSVLVVKMC